MRLWHRLFLAAAVLWIVVMATRCHLPRRTVAPSADSTSAVYLVRHGWHAGIAVRRDDVPTGQWPVLKAFPEAMYLEVGWGEAHYYPGRSRGVWGTLRAGVWPTGSVLHVVPVKGDIANRFSGRTVVRVPVGPTELDALTAFIAASFAADSPGTASPMPSRYYRNSFFYRSPLPYHVFNNCNHWAAAALEAAGCDTAPRWTFTVGQVLAQAKACGTLVQ
ncbi:MAG: DUF2459 domain-containing protein [Salinibacter sp.]